MRLVTLVAITLIATLNAGPLSTVYVLPVAAVAKLEIRDDAASIVFGSTNQDSSIERKPDGRLEVSGPGLTASDLSLGGVNVMDTLTSLLSRVQAIEQENAQLQAQVSGLINGSIQTWTALDSNPRMRANWGACVFLQSTTGTTTEPATYDDGFVWSTRMGKMSVVYGHVAFASAYAPAGGQLTVEVEPPSAWRKYKDGAGDVYVSGSVHANWNHVSNTGAVAQARFFWNENQQKFEILLKFSGTVASDGNRDTLRLAFNFAYRVVG